jgi:hypothetical protein
VRTDPKGSGEGQGRAMGLSKPRLTPVSRNVPEPTYTTACCSPRGGVEELGVVLLPVHHAFVVEPDHPCDDVVEIILDRAKCPAANS